MRFLVTCWPFVGHVFPQLAVAVALRERGHEVAFYTGASVAPVVEAEGFAVHLLGAVDEDAVLRCVRLLETGTAGGRMSPGLVRRTFREWLVETIPAQLRDLETVVAGWRPDVLVTDLSMWAPILVLEETTGIPVALSSTFMGPLIPGPDAPPAGFGLRPPRTTAQRLLARTLQGVIDRAGRGLRARVDEIRRDQGLGPLGMTVNAWTARLPLYLVPSLASLDGNRTDLPPTVHYVGPVLWYPPSTPAAEAWVASIPEDRPWVHVTESTLRYGDPFLLRAAVRGLPDAGLRVVATTGEHRDLDALGLGPLPEGAHVTAWASHKSLLPHCRAVVTNGGTATVMSALAHGLPLVVSPTTWDKPDNARRIAEAGVGIVLKPSRCTPERLRAAVQQLLAQPAYTRNAQAVAAQLAAAPGAAGAAQLLEALPTRQAVR
jgi:MGT family glycosyltransferase